MPRFQPTPPPPETPASDAAEAPLLAAYRIMLTADAWDLMGDANKERRRQVMQALTGQRLPLAKCGVTVVQAHLARHLGCPEANAADVEKAFAEWIQSNTPAPSLSKGGTLLRKVVDKAIANGSEPIVRVPTDHLLPPWFPSVATVEMLRPEEDVPAEKVRNAFAQFVEANPQPDFRTAWKEFRKAAPALTPVEPPTATPEPAESLTVPAPEPAPPEPLEHSIVRKIVCGLHVGTPVLGVVRTVMARIQGGRARMLREPKVHRRYLIAASIQHHEENRHLYHQVQAGTFGDYAPRYYWRKDPKTVLIQIPWPKPKPSPSPSNAPAASAPACDMAKSATVESPPSPSAPAVAPMMTACASSPSTTAFASSPGTAPSTPPLEVPGNIILFPVPAPAARPTTADLLARMRARLATR